MRPSALLLLPLLSTGLLPGCTGKAVVETENQPPSAPALSLGPTDARTDDDLVVSVRTEAADPDGDTVAYGYAWFQNGVARGDLTEATVPAAETTKGDVWEVTVTPNDGALDGAAATASITVLNSVPVVTLAFDPEAPTTEDELRVVPTAEDADGDPVTFTYAWSLEGAAAGYSFDTVPADATTQGDRWSVTVTPSDPEGAGLPVVAEVSISNSAPEVLAVSLVPDQPYVTDDVVATAAGYDADGDAIVFDYRWFVDGTEVQSGPSDTLPAGSFAKHQRVSVEVTPNDGVTDGTPFASTDATALNSLPSASTPAIDPATAYEASTLTCVPAGFTDADGDPEGWTYAWSVNGGAAGSTSTLDGAAFDKGDRVTCAATPEDGEESGEAATSAERTISNTAPVLASVDLSTYAPTENDTLSVTIGAVIDDDGDTLGYGYEWYVNGSVAGTTSTLASNRFAKNDSIYVVVTPWDGTSYGSPVSSAVATGTNTAPTITRVTLSPSAVYTSSTITASVTSSDLDGDTVSYSYDWYVDGYPRGSSTSATLSGASYFDKGQVVYVIVTPNDGDADGATATSSSVTVANTAPTAPVVAITPGDAVDGDDLTCTVVTAGTDADGDALTYSFDWDVDGVAYTGATDGGTSSVVDGGDVGGGETWACEAEATDGTAVSGSTSAEITTGFASYTTDYGNYMVIVSPGTFTMGGGNGDSTSIYVDHQVTLTHTFWIGEHEVTQSEWASWTAAPDTTPSYFTGSDLPVEQVSWTTVAKYANALSAAEGLTPCYTSSGSAVATAYLSNPYVCPGYRLPTEAEWEYAARADEDFTYAGSDTVTDVGWHIYNASSRTHNVCLLSPNAWGLCDMSGNVWEWTNDWYSASYGGYGTGASASDPAGPSTGSYRSLRGGAVDNYPISLEVSNRAPVPASTEGNNLGFRLARTVP
jgi:formylglycine-generating enzyme required for sulfatase activity